MSDILDAVDSFLAQEVTLEPYAGRDAYGKPSYGAGVTVRARVSGRAKRVINADGEETVSMLQVYFGSKTLVPTVRDRLTLPSPFQPTNPPLLAVAVSPDEDGTLVVTLFA